MTAEDTGWQAHPGARILEPHSQKEDELARDVHQAPTSRRDSS
jgi:hypothetical protein